MIPYDSDGIGVVDSTTGTFSTIATGLGKTDKFGDVVVVDAKST